MPPKFWLYVEKGQISEFFQELFPNTRQLTQNQILPLEVLKTPRLTLALSSVRFKSLSLKSRFGF